ncbi:MAG: DUF1446 domain-containing protein, partial [Betaproteobacteria bacterium]|nr:DUF1446 domain-containing protein [Betaproteobacteria bacterium]NBO43052.1 DUF1446 domain-containing protein [Betaproteobacteria bacterium]NBS21943.1 DUF1446 domain-containing protein [Betaproteobacteria bacterium]NBT65629.1 DUF1446 domain-containing protein [Betaproteobacteria bacterium]
MRNHIRIAGASGFWGDTAMAVPQLLTVADLDFLVFDYLAEVTLSIMAAQKAKSAEAGYARDFVDMTLKPHLGTLLERGIRVVSNAGGLNPAACVTAIKALAQEQGLTVKIAWVIGDDLMHAEARFREAQRTEMYSGASFPDQVLSINAYLGAEPIARALDEGAHIVITGRCVDSAVTLGAMMHAFGWHRSQQSRPSAALLDCYAQASLAGHLIECGAQCTGGLFTDWQTVPDWENIGFPVLDAYADGQFEIFKPEGTGGLISPATVSEQLLYEIGDPAAYRVPDVVCDWSKVQIRACGLDRVRVEGAVGYPAPTQYKVSLTASEGWKNQALLVIAGEQAHAKAQRTAEALLGRIAKMLEQQGLAPLSETHVEIVGAESMYGNASRALQAREVVLKIAVKSRSKASLELFAREFAPAATSMAPGTTGFGQGRPSPSPVIRLFSFLEDKKQVPVKVMLDGECVAEINSLTAEEPDGASSQTLRQQAPADPSAIVQRTPRANRPLDAMLEAGLDSRLIATAAKAWMDPHWPRLDLLEIAHGRSGDKGNIANIGLVARHAEDWTWLLAIIDESLLRRVFAHRQPLRIHRYPLAGTQALNLVLEGVLGGGGMMSLHTDNLAKAYAQILLGAQVPCPPRLLRNWRPRQ